MNIINILPPTTLYTDDLRAELTTIESLLAEVEELVQDDDATKRYHKLIPSAYTQGPQHRVYFYNKMYFVAQRYFAVCVELSKRGFKIDSTKHKDIVQRVANLPTEWQGSKVTHISDDYYLNMLMLTMAKTKSNPSMRAMIIDYLYDI